VAVSGNTEQVGWMLYTSYLIPFAIASDAACSSR
jgi:NADH:ubiquinone oxidoreductase subunit 6 (subunit J)